MLPGLCSLAGLARTPGTIVFVGSKTATSNATNYTIATTSLTDGLGGDAAIGDFLIVAHADTSGSDANMAVAGTGLTFTEAIEDAQEDVSGGVFCNLGVSYAYCDVAPPATLTMTSSTSGELAAVLMVFRIVDSSSPMDVAATSAKSDGSGTPNPPSITPATTGACVVSIGAAAHNSGDGLTFSAGSSGYSDFAVADRDVGGDGAVVGMCYKLNATGGAAENPGAFTVSGSSSDMAWVAVTLAIRPA